MKYKVIIIFLSVMLYGCEQTKSKKLINENFEFEKRYKNIGFALIDDKKDRKNKSLDNRSLNIFHKSLKKRSMVKITNPKNNKSLIAEVKSNKIKFSEFYNSIISKRIAEDLELDLENPYIEIVLISKNSTFVAKKTKTFEEEKKVAEKAPIDGIQIKDLNETLSKKKRKKKKYFLIS